MSDVQHFTFTPTFEGDGAGRLNVKGVPTERGWSQARIDADIRCSFCGHGFKAGDETIFSAMRSFDDHARRRDE